MKTFSLLLAACALLLSQAPVVRAEKPLPPAFGKELVPDMRTQEHRESKDAIEEEQQQPKREKASQRPAGYRRIPRGKIHTQLDGDEDGGESGGDDYGL